MQRFRLAIAFVLALAFGLPVASAGTSITFNGATYTVPSVADANWGQNVSNYLTAIASGTLQKTGGSFTLTNDANFGSTYGLVAQYVKSQTAPVAGTGVLRLGNGDGVTWRNAGNSADLALSVNGSNVLTFNGTPLVGAATGSPYQVLTVPSGGGAGVYGAVALGQSAAVTGTLGVANGGTGLTAGTSGGVLAFTASGTLTSSNALPANGVLYGGGAGFTPGATAAGSTGQLLLATTGAAPSWGAVNLGTTAAVTGTLAVTNGGTGQSTKTAAFNALSPLTTKGDVTAFDGTNAVRLGVGGDGTVLTADSVQTTGLKWSSVLTNPMTTLGDIMYENATPAAARLAGNTTSTKKFLTQTGTGSVSAAPGWATIVAGDLPTSISAATTFSGGVVFGNGATNLNWYEEGTFTPLISATGVSGTVTYGLQVGSFTRIGRRVFFTMVVTYTNWTGSPTGGVIVGGLPYAEKSTTNLFVELSVLTDNITLPTSGLWITAQGIVNTTTLALYAGKTGANSVAVDPASNSGAATRGIYVSGSYDTN